MSVAVDDTVTQAFHLESWESILQLFSGQQPFGVFGMNAQTVVPPQPEPNHHREDSGMTGPFGGIGKSVIPVYRDDEIDRLDQVVGNHPQHSLFPESATDEPEPHLRQVAHPAMQQFGGTARCSTGPVAAVDDRNPLPAMGRIQGDSGPDNAAADDDEVEIAVESVQMVLPAPVCLWIHGPIEAESRGSNVRSGVWGHRYTRRDGLPTR